MPFFVRWILLLFLVNFPVWSPVVGLGCHPEVPELKQLLPEALR